MDKQLKMLAGALIAKSDMSNSAKIQMLNFVRNEASIPQIKALLLDGEIKKLDDQSEEIVTTRFEQSDFMKAINEGAVGSIVGMLVFTPPLWVAWRGISALMSQKRRKCGTFRISKERDKCLELVPIITIRKKIEIVGKAIGQCNKNPDPGKCKAKGQKALASLKKKLATKQEKYKLRWSQKPIK